MSKEAMKLALEALEYIEHNYMSLPAPAEKAITALRKALAEQPACEHEWLRGGCLKCGQSIEQPAQQEPVACIGYWNQKTGAYYKPDQISASHQKLIEDGILRRCYTAPPQRTWVGLTEEEIKTSLPYSVTRDKGCFHAGALWAEAKLKEKNT